MPHVPHPVSPQQRVIAAPPVYVARLPVAPSQRTQHDNHKQAPPPSPPAGNHQAARSASSAQRSAITPYLYDPRGGSRRRPPAHGTHRHQRCFRQWDEKAKKWVITCSLPSLGTPALIAAFGAECAQQVGGHITVEMKNPGQAPLLRVQSLKASLRSLCVDQRLPAVSQMPLADLFWLPGVDPSNVKVLGIQRDDVIHNLLDPSEPRVSNQTPGLERIAPFGTRVGKNTGAVFLDLSRVNSKSPFPFRWGRIVKHDDDTALIRVNNENHKVKLALVAPGTAARDNVDLTDATRQVPPAGLALLEILQDLRRSCAGDEHTSSTLLEAVAAVQATGIVKDEGDDDGDSAGTVARLRASAQALTQAAKYARSDRSTCSGQIKGKAPSEWLDRAARQSLLLGCRVRIASLAKRPEMLHSKDDRTFYKDLLDLDKSPGVHEAAKTEVQDCLSRIALDHKELVESFRAHGIGTGEHRLSDEDYRAVEQACSSDVEYLKPSGAMQHLVRMARNKSSDAREWATALRLAEAKAPWLNGRAQMTKTCSVAAEDLVKKIERLSCRQKYRSVLSAEGAARPDTADETNEGLAREVASKYFDGTHVDDKLLKDKALMQCMKKDDESAYQAIREHLGEQSSQLDDEEVQRKIDEAEKIARDAIRGAQASLRGTCERSDKAGHQDNPLTPELSEDALLGPLMRKQGQVDLLELQSALPGIEDVLRAPVSASESASAQKQRQNCSDALERYRQIVEPSLCRIRLMRSLKTVGSNAQLEQKWVAHERRSPSPESPKKEVDELCIKTLNPHGAATRARAAKASKRTCASAEARTLLEAFCNDMQRAAVPFNFVDFLSLLVLASLPPWPASKTQLRHEWLTRRQRTLGSDTEPLACSSQETLVQKHGRSPAGVSEAHVAVQIAVKRMLDGIQRRGVPLADIANCACASAGIVSPEKREEMSRLSAWYWDAGHRILARGLQDAESVILARAIMVQDVLESELEHVSSWGHVTLKSKTPEDSILKTIWKSYLTQLLTGCLAIFWGRIEEMYPKDVACRLAMIDTFFYVVALDLVDVSSATTAQDSAILQRAAAFNSSTGKDMGAALGVAAIASFVTGGPVLTATAAALAGGAALHVGSAALQGMAKPKLRIEEEDTSAFGKNTDSYVKKGLKNFYDSVFKLKKTAVPKALMRLGNRAMEQANRSQSQHTASTNDFTGFAQLSTLREQMWREIEAQPSLLSTLVARLEPPGFFPLAPPGGGDPAKICNNGVC